MDEVEIVLVNPLDPVRSIVTTWPVNPGIPQNIISRNCNPEIPATDEHMDKGQDSEHLEDTNF